MRKITFFAKSPARPRKPKGIAAKIVTLMTLNTKAGITIDAALLDAVLATISTLTAERDAAVARAMPGWRYLATWDAVNTVEARHNDEPAPGLYAVWKPGWPYPSAASVQFGVFATDEESPAPDDYLLGAWISGPLPLPDIPTPDDATAR